MENSERRIRMSGKGTNKQNVREKLIHQKQMCSLMSETKIL